MSVGDVNSSERGSGARYNDGKPDISLIPLALIAGTVPQQPNSDPQLVAEQNAVRLALSFLGNFQTTRNVQSLDAALAVLAPYWEECARVFAYGLRKYAAWNWAKGMAWSIPLACAGRHALAILRGEAIDDPTEPNNGSGLRHIGHFMCNVVMARTFVDTFKEGDDLPPTALFVPPPANQQVTLDSAPPMSEQLQMAEARKYGCDCDRCMCPASAHAYQEE